MNTHWTIDRILELSRSFQPACILAAAADLELFDVMGTSRLTATEIARRLRADERGVIILLDALAALHFLGKKSGHYFAPAQVRRILTRAGSESVLAMIQHQANCLRRWDQLAKVVKTGRPARSVPSVRGEQGDAASFIGAMHDLNHRVADIVIREIQPLPFRKLLDVGGASGTWTLAWLRANPSGTAILFDLPHVIPMAKKRLGQAGVLRRVTLVSGDFYKDVLPTGADLVWISAIVHQNSRRQNQELFRKAYQALDRGGRIAIRDILMKPSRIVPVSGALFAVNMLVGTEGGGTFTFSELRADLKSAGFVGARVARHDNGMNSVIVARKQL